MTRIFLMLVACLSMGANLSAESFTLPLYPTGGIPNYRDAGEAEEHVRDGILRIGRVQTPTIEVFLPDPSKATGEAIVICPGGGYWILAYELEGTEIARWWAERGVAGVVLKYRLPTSKAQIEPRLSPLMDAQRALRLVRHQAEDWRINPNRVGIMGFSAGGHLAATASVHYDNGNPDAADPIEQQSSRPDFSMLVYPVISFSGEFSHVGSRRALLGEIPDTELVHHYSAEKNITPDTPPAVLVHARDDAGVPIANSHAYAEALWATGVAAEIHAFDEGGHGFGAALDDPVLGSWLPRCAEWLNNRSS